MKHETFYNEGRKQANIKLYGEVKQKEMAEKIYNDFNNQANFEEDGEFNEKKLSFISGWVDAMMD